MSAQPHRILLTGANGYIASHILSQLLSPSSPLSHSVRAVVRSQSKVDAIRALFPSTPSSRLDFAVVPDITVPGAFDQALQPDNGAFDIVMHTASPFLFAAANSVQDFMDPAIKGTTEILAGIQRVAKSSVKRVIITSSFAAVGTFGPAETPGKIYTEDDWNPVTLQEVEEAWAKGNKGLAYLASKTFAERAAWQESEGKEWDLVVLNPPMVYGPLAHRIDRMEDLSESTGRIWTGFFGDKKPEDELIPDGFPLYIDVRDLATAHILALPSTTPDAGNKRFNVCAGDIRSQEIADILRKEVPGAEARVPRGEPGKKTRPSDATGLDCGRAERVLGMQWRGREETFGEMGRQFLEIERALRG
jgi:nucleoside-diphosphate-sugar epimerase